MFILYFHLEKRKSILGNGKAFRACLCCGLQQRAVTSSICFALGSFSERPHGFGVTGSSSCPVRLWTHSSLGLDLFNAVAFNWPTETLSPGKDGSYLLSFLPVLDLGFLPLHVTWSNASFRAVPTIWVFPCWFIFMALWGSRAAAWNQEILWATWRCQISLQPLVCLVSLAKWLFSKNLPPTHTSSGWHL